jgi:hypothetical protein
MDYMGCIFALANPDAREMWREAGWPSSRACFRPAEQRIGSGPVGSGLVAMRPHPDDLSFEACDSLVQFGLRIGGEVFACEAAGRIALGPRKIAVIHFAAASQGNGLAVNP